MSKRFMRLLAAVSAVIFALVMPVLLTAAPATAGARGTVDHAPHSFVLLNVTAHQFPRPYTVRRGDTLTKIAAREYGHANRWPELWWKNRDAIHNPDMLQAGQRITLYGWHPDLGWARRAAMRAIPKPKPVITHYARHASAAAPSAAAPQAPAVSGYYSYAALESLWESAGGPAWAAAQAAHIAECESGGNPRAYNPSGASGLWQILGQVVGGNIFDPMVNALNAVAKFRASGDTFAQWVCQ